MKGINPKTCVFMLKKQRERRENVHKIYIGLTPIVLEVTLNSFSGENSLEIMS